MILSKNSPLASLMQTFPRPGRLDWIGLRPAKRVALIRVDVAQAITGAGLEGDHYSGRTGNRGITLLQAEHLPVIAALKLDSTLGEGRVARAHQCLSGWRHCRASQEWLATVGKGVSGAAGARHRQRSDPPLGGDA